MRKILENLELILTAAGLLVIFVVHSLFYTNTDASSWKFSAFTAIAVGVLHGLIFWLVRKRQSRIRRAAMGQVEHMLKDIINNQLCIISFTSGMQKNNIGSIADATACITNFVHNIHTALNEINEESLNLWKANYTTLLDGSERSV